MHLGDPEKWENGSEAALEKADNILKKHNSIKLTQEEKSLIWVLEMKLVIKKLNCRPKWLHW